MRAGLIANVCVCVCVCVSVHVCASVPMPTVATMPRKGTMKGNERMSVRINVWMSTARWGGSCLLQRHHCIVRCGVALYSE